VSLARFRELFWLDLRHFLRRPLLWIWIVILVLLALLSSAEGMIIQTGDADIGGTKAWVTSEFNVALMLAVIVPLCYTFFLAVASGMPIIRADEQKIGDLVHSTPVRPGEYVWAKFLAGLAAFFLVLAVHVGASILFNHFVIDAEDVEHIGDFALGNYLRPALFFALPVITLTAGVTFAVGELTRRPIVVFVLPVALFLVCISFLWTWSPEWLDPRLDRALMLVDPTGFRWLRRTWLTVDRGVEFYNTAPIVFDVPFVISRVFFSVTGLVAVWISHVHFGSTLRGVRTRIFSAVPAVAHLPAPAAAAVPSGADTRRMGELGMTSRPPGFIRSFACVLRAELNELGSHPGLYLFIPLIVLDSVNEGFLTQGPFDTRILATPGLLAMSTLPGLTVLLALLLMFYTVESLRRERGTQLAPIVYSSPMGSGAVYFGKITANAIIGLVAVLVTFLTCWIIIAIQGKVPFDAMPFAIVWGLLLLPTFVLWCSFVAMVYTLLRSAYATYGISLAALIFTGWELAIGEMSWRWNWPLWNTMRWSDAGVFPLDREALLLNRLMVLAVALLFVIVAVRIFPRREFDPQRILLRLRPRPLLKTALLLGPFAIVPIGLNVWLGHRIDVSWQGDYAEKEQKDYWRKNIATWRDAPVPDIARAEVKLELEPERRWFRTEGTFELVNHTSEPLASFPVTGGPHWEELAWTVDGETHEPEERKFLYVFAPEVPLAPDETMTIGFSFEGIVNEGISRNGGGADQFILPAGVVLHSFGPTFVPTMGFMEGVGVDEDNASEARDYPDDFYEGDTPSGFGGGWSPYPVRLEVTAPAEYTINGIGVLESDVVDEAGRRTVVWKTDHPVSFFNVIAGKWDVQKGEGTAVYYFPEHPYNIDEMVETLDGARKFYSEWFHPFPWSELKISEFAALAMYAQGFATNITFSEGIGFLTESDEESNAAFFVTAHESAHQWWGNILAPGRGPGGNLLSEGTANFSTILLFEQMKGDRARMAFCRQLESQYGARRVADSEKPLVEIDGSRPGDTTVTYDKAAWVYWMLLHHMGRQRCLAGMRSFIAHYVEARDHPVLQDFVAHLRDFAPDPDAYDEFTRQWFFEQALPEYELSSVESSVNDDVWIVTGVLENVGTGRMPVEISAERGKRFPKEGKELKKPFVETRTSVVLGAGESREFRIECAFEPQRVVVDPDVLVLQLHRKLVVHRFSVVL